jgi:integrase
MNKLEEYKEYLKARNLSANYYNITKIFLKYLDDKELTQELITQFFNEKKYSIAAKNMFIKAGRHYQAFLGNIDNEWQKITLIRPERKIPDYLTLNDIDRIISYLITYNYKFSSVKIRAIMYTLFFTGVRKGEFLYLHRKDFNMNDNSVKVWGEKTKTERLVIFPDKLKDILMEYFKSEPNEKQNAFNITIHQINYLAEKMNKNGNGKHITIHTLRHSYARNLVEQGINLGIISRQLGHSSILTTQIYTSPDDELCKRVLKTLWKIK